MTGGKEGVFYSSPQVSLFLWRLTRLAAILEIDFGSVADYELKQYSDM
jgi:hypothetical protein